MAVNLACLWASGSVMMKPQFVSWGQEPSTRSLFFTPDFFRSLHNGCLNASFLASLLLFPTLCFLWLWSQLDPTVKNRPAGRDSMSVGEATSP